MEESSRALEKKQQQIVLMQVEQLLKRKLQSLKNEEIEIQGDLNALRRELENLDPNSVHTTVTEQRIESSYLSI